MLHNRGKPFPLKETETLPRFWIIFCQKHIAKRTNPLWESHFFRGKMFEIKVRLGGGAKPLSDWTWEDLNWFSWGHPEEDIPRMLKEAFGRHATLWSFLPPHRCQIARVFCFPSFQCHSKDETKFRDLLFLKIYSTDLIILSCAVFKSLSFWPWKQAQAAEKLRAEKRLERLESRGQRTLDLQIHWSWKAVFQQSQTCLTATELHWWKTRNSCLGTRSIQLHFCCDSSVESSFHHHHHMLIIILDHKRRKSKLWKSHQSLMRLPHVTRLNSKGKPGKVPIFPMRFKILNDHDSDCGFSVLVNT